MVQQASIAEFPAVGEMARQQLADMDKIVDLSQKMLDQIDVCNWQELLSLQTARDQALRACLRPPIQGEHAEAARTKIQALLAQNQAILDQVNAAKVRLLDEMRQSQQNHRAVSAYLSNAR